ncbi:hypothetical protein E4T38_03001 [Aureobasidium subglaciale]|nr:hypothetical protein E4T38_03001 [Aureobasidium subglaciale]KAI5226885.1 hypothetical protein E4T40_02775 [Aureobasidium subglaciale]KAI5230211.1 hypothetical protein E4T41_02998 [Aureobasidium subglaciale]KAI5264640.1 hypothetical protein E4T46_02776 [Aureobasidium subglaciale]
MKSSRPHQLANPTSRPQIRQQSRQLSRTSTQHVIEPAVPISQTSDSGTKTPIMELPKEMIFLDTFDQTAEETINRGVENEAAVHRYFDCLSRGWLGQAFIERYTYTFFSDIADDEDEILTDIFANAMGNQEDPGRDVLRRVVERIDHEIARTQEECPSSITKLPEAMILLEPLNSTAEEIIQQGAKNPAAAHRYINCLSRGWIGQALVERYTYDQSPDTPEGMIHTNGEQDGIFKEWLKPIKDEIKDDLREALAGGYDEMIITERDIYAREMTNVEDPGREMLRELVEVIDQGLQIYVTISGSQRLAPPIELRWRYGLEDTVMRLSAKVLEKDILGMSVKKSGRDLHFTYQIDDDEGGSNYFSLMEEMGAWN